VDEYTTMDQGDSVAAEAFSLAFAAHLRGDILLACAGYRDVLRVNPDHGYALHSLGVIAMESGDLHTALELFDRAVQSTPGEPGFTLSFAIALRSSGQVDRATVTLRDLVGRSPEFVSGWETLHGWFLDSNRTEDAANALAAIVRLQTVAASKYNDIGKSFTDAGKYDEAFSAFRAGIACNPRSSMLFVSLGRLLLRAGRTADAILHLQQALKLNPQSIEARACLEKAASAGHANRAR
jgi:protein O-GlcNAc transferase